jgi:hypothetical protein
MHADHHVGSHGDHLGYKGIRPTKHHIGYLALLDSKRIEKGHVGALTDKVDGVRNLEVRRMFLNIGLDFLSGVTVHYSVPDSE